MKTAWAICAGLLVSGWLAAAETIQVKLDFVRVEASEACPYSACGHDLVSTYRKSKTGLVVPEEGEKKPDPNTPPQGLAGWASKVLGDSKRDLCFGTLPVEGRKGGYAFALERKPDSEGYETLYVDINEDGAIAEEERFTAVPVVKAPMERHPGPMFTPVVSVFTFEMPFGRAANAPVDYAFQVRVMAEKETKDSLEVTFSPLCYRKGRAMVDGAPYSVTLMDQTMNGRFNDYAVRREGYWDGDWVVFVPEGGKDADPAADRELLNSMRMVGEKAYRVSVSADGAEVTLAPAELPCGRLKINPAAETVRLAGELGPFCIRRAGSAVLPAGNYTLMDLTYAAKAKDGVAWKVSNYGFPSQTIPKVEIKPGKTVKMPFGAPFTSRVTDVHLGGRGALTMKVGLTGQGGERYEYHCTTSDGKWLPTADVVLKTKNGKEIARVKRSRQTSVDAIPPDYYWEGFFPKEGLTATCDLGLPWKTRQEKVFINADRK